MPTNKGKSKDKIPVAAASNQRTFSAELVLRPRGKSADIIWPDNKMSFVLVHAEIMKIAGLDDYLAFNRGERRITLTIQVHEQPPLAAVRPPVDQEYRDETESVDLPAGP